MIDFKEKLTESDIRYVQNKLPELFQIAELECTRGGRIGMEVGIVRENILSAFLLKKFGEENTDFDVPTNEKVIDGYLFNTPISIKTFIGKTYSAQVKVFWMVTGQISLDYIKTYSPTCDLIIGHVKWGGDGALYYVPKEVQNEIFNDIKIEKYLKVPNFSSNERGISLSKEAYNLMIKHKLSYNIPIHWEKQNLEINPIDRWTKMLY